MQNNSKNVRKQRPTWDQYFLKLAMLASERATCPRMHCGCILVKNRFVLATGYNGSKPGEVHCEDVGCLLVNNHCVRTSHAEINAIAQATKHGIALVGATVYVTNMPCTNCANALVENGIRRVVIFSDYHDTSAEKLFKQHNIELCRLPMPDLLIHYDIKNYSSAVIVD